MGNPAGDIKQAHLVIVGPQVGGTEFTLLSIPSGAGVIHSAIELRRTFVVPESANSEFFPGQKIVIDGVEILAPEDLGFDVEVIRRHGVETRIFEGDVIPAGVNFTTRMTFSSLPYHGLRFSTSLLMTVTIIFTGLQFQQQQEAKVWYTEDH